MRWKIAVAATAVLFVLSSASLIGQGKGNGGSKGPKAQAPSTKPAQSPKATAPTSAKGPKAPKAGAPTTTKSGHGKTTMTAKATAPKGKSDVAGSKTKSTASGMTTAKNTKSAKAPDASGKTTKSKASTATAKNTKSSSTTTASTSMAGSGMNESTDRRTDGTTSTSTDSGTTGSPDTVQLSAVQQKLQKNTNLASKLQSRLPAGTDLMTAADGFRNLGQFVAAVNVSNNLGIPFTDLKTKMVDEHLSLGQSIQKLKPTASGTIEAQRADYEAQGMIYQSEQTQASTTTTTTTSKKKGKSSGSGGGSDE